MRQGLFSRAGGSSVRSDPGDRNLTRRRYLSGQRLMTDETTWLRRRNLFITCKIVLTLRSYCRNILCQGICQYHKLGGILQIGSPLFNLCKGKSFTEEPSWQRRRRQKRRNTNRSAKRYFARAWNLTSLSREAPLERRFLLGQRLTDGAQNSPSRIRHGVSQLWDLRSPA
jgi:hypothetical protein